MIASTELCLEIGGVSVLIQSDELPLTQMLDWHRPFECSQDDPNVVIEIFGNGGKRGIIGATDSPFAVEPFRQYLARQYARDRRFAGSQANEDVPAAVLALGEQCWALDSFRESWSRLASDTDRYVMFELFERSLLFLDRHQNRASIFVPELQALSKFAVSGVLYRHVQLTYALLVSNFGGFVLHAAGVVRGGNGYAFVGPSGSGKSTLVWSLQGREAILADDSLVIREMDGAFKAYATPWNMLMGSWTSSLVEGVREAPLTFVGLIYKGTEGQLEELDALTGTSMLLANILPMLYRFDVPSSQRVLEMAARLCERIPCYRLGLVRGEDVWSLIDGHDELVH